MLPQNVDGMKMYLDFTVIKNDNPTGAKNYMLDLGRLTITDYLANGSYNWKLTITPQFVYFSATQPTVEKWDDANITTPPQIDIK
jgi:hypothetical protein